MAATATVPSAPRDRESLRVLRRLASHVVLPAVLIVAILVILVYAVFPTRTWMDQRAEIDQLEQDLVDLEATNAALAERVVALNTTDEIERMARRDHGLVLPGEEAYAVLPPAPAPVRIPAAWPFTHLARLLD